MLILTRFFSADKGWRAMFWKDWDKDKIKLLFIDGDHSYEGVKKDYELFWPKLEKGGFIVFHDATVKRWGKLKGFGVWKLINEIKDNGRIILPLPTKFRSISQTR